MNTGLLLQILALGMLLVPAALLTVPWVMAAQALSGVAKDLNKMSAKSAIKTLVPGHDQTGLYRWVALLTGSKNALKGVGFFLGAGLLSALGFAGAVLAMAAGLLLVFLSSLFLLKQDLGRASSKPRFQDIFAKSPAINYLSAARLFLFSSRDVWFVVALPVYLSQTLVWDHWQTGGFLALWVIAYGIVQALAPRLTGISKAAPDGRSALRWACLLATIPALIAVALNNTAAPTFLFTPASVLIIGLMVFGVIFAINSALHSYLIVSYARDDGVSLDVGFYYMANAMGRLLGTVLSGWVFQQAGLAACLWISSAMIVLTALISLRLPSQPQGLSS
jgi:predicted MFS family arabinose efflux permease